MSGALRQGLAAAVCGLLFGAGLQLSGMTDPGRVLGFLDVSGAWNPALLGVLGGAVLVSLAGFQFARRCLPRPWLDDRFHLVPRNDIDRHLLLGGALFGLGWGLAGYCPGPALAGLALGNAEAPLFVLAMLAGGLAQGWWARRGAPSAG